MNTLKLMIKELEELEETIQVLSDPIYESICESPAPVGDIPVEKLCEVAGLNIILWGFSQEFTIVINLLKNSAPNCYGSNKTSSRRT